MRKKVYLILLLVTVLALGIWATSPAMNAAARLLRTKLRPVIILIKRDNQVGRIGNPSCPKLAAFSRDKTDLQLLWIFLELDVTRCYVGRIMKLSIEKPM